MCQNNVKPNCNAIQCVIIHEVTLLSVFQVQEDLKQLREKLSHGDGKVVSIEELENALSKTEQGLQVYIYT